MEVEYEYEGAEEEQENNEDVVQQARKSFKQNLKNCEKFWISGKNTIRSNIQSQ